MSEPREPIAVIGTGYVGLVTAAGFAELGHEVWCVDVDAEKVARLQRGEIPIHEPGLAEVVSACRERLHFGTDLGAAAAQARLLFVAVGTPPTPSGDADLSAVHAVIAAVPAGAGEHAIVMKSTVPVGTGAAVRRELERQGKGGYAYVSCPEFLREGSALADFRRPDRVVVGDDDAWAGDAVAGLYAPLGAPLVRTDVASAEMIKLASNAFLATKISFINEIANVCEETGADVAEVARGMGMDARIGPSFLRPGIGFGGSCLAGDETVLIRRGGRTTLVTLEDLWRRLEPASTSPQEGVLEPDGLEVLALMAGADEPQFLPAWLMTRRPHAGQLVHLKTKTGRTVRCTPDHPWVVGDGTGGASRVLTAEEIGTGHWLPIATGWGAGADATRSASLLTAVESAELSPDRLIVRPAPDRLAALVGASIEDRRRVFLPPARAAARTGEAKRTGTVRLDEAERASLPMAGARIGTSTNGAYPSVEISLDEVFWRVVGLYLAEGHTRIEPGGSSRIVWSFHPTREEHLVDEVAAFWLRHGVTAAVHSTRTARQVTVRSRIAAAWWTRVLGLGRTSYGQRIPDLAWDRPAEDRWALLSGLWEGDGSWSLINGGPSVILELGTVSDELADGALRMLAGLGIVASKRTGRTARSTKDTHWLRISGADQVQRALALVPGRDRPGVRACLERQRKRIAPTGHRRFDDGCAWVRVTAAGREDFDGYVYSLEVPGAHTFVTSDGLVTHNCFPKDVSALKQLAGNSGYHFQLLNAVIEVNELQKRRVVAKLQRHLGDIVGSTVALLGLAFKPETDDLREASSLVLAARLQGAGAAVRAYDPVAMPAARDLMPGVEFAGSALDALAGADAAVLVTEWPEFVTIDWAAARDAMAGTLIVDGRNALDPDVVRAAGLDYEGVGRP